MQTMNYLGHQVGDARFQNHWNTFITEWDIANIGEYIHQSSPLKLYLLRVFIWISKIIYVYLRFSPLQLEYHPRTNWILGYDNYDISNKQEYKIYAPGGIMISEQGSAPS